MSMGYDTNRWFQHFEQAAMSMQATDTVRYVSNINKYFLAYRLAETLDCLKGRIRNPRLADP